MSEITKTPNAASGKRKGKMVSFANQKGGVGKTTSAVNIAASLGLQGYKVLLIDLDPQGNSTSGLGVRKRGLEKTTRELLLLEYPAKELIQETEFTNLSVIPCKTSLATVESEIYGGDGDAPFRMREALAPIRSEFDYIIVDCPPSLGLLTLNAFVASDGIVVPMQCEFYALEGLSQLMHNIKGIKQKHNPALTIVGILATMYDPRLLLSKQVMDELRNRYTNSIFETTVSRNVKLSEAPGFGKPVYYHDKRSKGAKEYFAIASEFATRI